MDERLTSGIRQIAQFQGNVLAMEQFGGKVLVATESGVFSLTPLTNIDTGETSFLVDPILISNSLLPRQPVSASEGHE